MSDESRDTTTRGEQPERRSGRDRRKGVERRKENRGIWNAPVLKHLVDRRKGGDRRSGADRRHD